MYIRHSKGKYTIYDDNDQVVIITHRKEVAMNYVKDSPNVTSN